MTRYITRAQANELIADALARHELAHASKKHRGLYMFTASLDDFGIWEPLRLPLSTGASGVIISCASIVFFGAAFPAAGMILGASIIAGGVGSIVSEVGPALAGPLTGALEWLARKRQKPPSSTGRNIPFSDRGKQRTIRMPNEPIRPEYATITIPSTTLKDGEREINVEKLCGFLKSASITGMWQKRNQNTYGWDEWADIRHWVMAEYPGVWDKTPPTQFLHLALPKIRAQATIPTNQPTTNQATTLELACSAQESPFFKQMIDLFNEQRGANDEWNTSVG